MLGEKAHIVSGDFDGHLLRIRSLYDVVADMHDHAYGIIVHGIVRGGNGSLMKLSEFFFVRDTRFLDACTPRIGITTAKHRNASNGSHTGR